MRTARSSKKKASTLVNGTEAPKVNPFLSAFSPVKPQLPLDAQSQKASFQGGQTVCPHCGRCQHCGTVAPVNPFTSYIINSGTATATPLQTTWTMNTAQFNS